MQGKNKPLLRYLDKQLSVLVRKGYSALVFGPRQVGKTTLVKQILVNTLIKREYPLQNPSVRLELEAKPGKLIDQIHALEKPPYVFIDEAQKIPALFDAVQYLIDENKAKFILTGSSARKLKRHGVNLLPGRIKHFLLDPLLWGEMGLVKGSSIKELEIKNINNAISYSIEDIMTYGSLPRIVLLPESDREDFLKSYAYTYLEEEIRAEALSRNIGAFSRFLELAANESGTNPNFTKLSNESGVSQPSIKEYFRVLEDTLIVEKVDPYLKNARKRILSSSRHFFFDLGVRNTLSRFPLVTGFVQTQKGILFEHAVILEIIRRIHVLNKNYTVHYWRTASGAEVDCVVDTGNKLIPIEIKSSDSVALSELKGLKIFLEDYRLSAEHGYVVSLSAKKKEMLAKNITLIPWNYL